MKIFGKKDIIQRNGHPYFSDKGYNIEYDVLGWNKVNWVSNKYGGTYEEGLRLRKITPNITTIFNINAEFSSFSKQKRLTNKGNYNAYIQYIL